MADLVERALQLWRGPLPDDPDALAAFRDVYRDPLQVNGSPTPLQVLVDRARMMQDAFGGLTHHLDARVEAPGRMAFAFRIVGRHVGPLLTPLGEIAATGRDVEVAGLDIFEIGEDERVSAVWAVADYLGLLMQAGAVALDPPS